MAHKDVHLDTSRPGKGKDGATASMDSEKVVERGSENILLDRQNGSQHSSPNVGQAYNLTFFV